MAEFNLKAWKQATTKDIELDGGRVATIRAIPSFRLMSMLNIPVGQVAMKGNTAKATTKMFTNAVAKMDAAELQNVIEQVVIAGTVRPRILPDSEPASEDAIHFSEIGERRAMKLFQEICAVNAQDEEGAADAAAFRNE